ncbi:hypothetical protein, partial [Arthrobacter sp.]|uniref:hypothetical protein n=1 Tax=Arthrobacter sp. TaxID=1667 RepID=UPI0028123030
MRALPNSEASPTLLASTLLSSAFWPAESDGEGVPSAGGAVDSVVAVAIAVGAAGTAGTVSAVSIPAAGVIPMRRLSVTS